MDNSEKKAHVRTYTAEHTEADIDSAKLLLVDSAQPADSDPFCANKAANQVHLYAQEFLSFLDQLGQNSLDGYGCDILQIVNSGTKDNNAHWTGSIVRYGDGDGITFNNFTSPEIVAHELSHGISDFNSNLGFSSDSLAIKESFSDCMGIAFRQWKYKQIPSSDRSLWIYGRRGEVLSSHVQGEGMRNVLYPSTAYDDPALGGKDSQLNYYDAKAKGGAYDKSGIGNRAFGIYSIALKDLGEGNSWEKPAKIWLESMKRMGLSKEDSAKGVQYLDVTYRDWANKTITVARGLYKDKPQVAQCLEEAWAKVGVLKWR